MQVRRETLQAAYRLRIAVGSYGDVMHAIAHIDPRRMRMDYFQTRVLGLQTPRPFLSLFPATPQLHVCHPPLLSERRNPVRPGDDRFRKSLQRGRRTIATDSPCHHASDRQYRSPAFIRARSTNGKSALARRTESAIRF